ncbi:hypothetical protein OAF27_01080 [Verrucomicrobiales bacterium]|nr:hypothetical protein [Verrucomicrobiales bacterium]
MKTTVALLTALTCPTLASGSPFQITQEGNVIDSSGMLPESGNSWFSDSTTIVALPAGAPTSFGTTREENDVSIFTFAPVVIPGGGPAFGFPILAHEILPIATAVFYQADTSFGLSADQRGFPRVSTAISVNGYPEDIEAIEYQQNR